MEESLLERRAVRALASRRISQSAVGTFPQVCEGARAPSGRRRRSRRYSGRVLGNSQHHQGSQLLAAVMDRWRHSADLGP